MLSQYVTEALEQAGREDETERRRAPSAFLPLHATYLSEPIHRPAAVLDRLRVIAECHQFDTIVGIGISGGLIVSLAAHELDKFQVLVRKTEGASSHSPLPFEGRLGRRWLFVDDLISTGATLRHVHRVVSETASAFGFETTFVGAFLYYTGGKHVARFRAAEELACHLPRKDDST